MHSEAVSVNTGASQLELENVNCVLYSYFTLSRYSAPLSKLGNDCLTLRMG